MLRLIDRIDVHGDRIIVTPQTGGRKEPKSGNMEWGPKSLAANPKVR